MTSARLSSLRAGLGPLIIGLIWLLGAIAAGTAFWRGVMPLTVAILALAIAGGVLAAWAADRTGPLTRYLSSSALVGMVGLVVFAASRSPWQIDMHMAFFAALAVVACWVCWVSVVLAGATIAVHHLLLNVVYPSAVFPDGADLNRVLVHAVIVVVQIAALATLTHRLAHAFGAADAAAEKARDAEAESAELAASERAAQEEHDARRQAVEAAIAQFRGRIELLIATFKDATHSMISTTSAVSETAGTVEQSTQAAVANSAEATSNVEDAAAAAEELTSSISEINRQLGMTTDVVRNTADEAEATNMEVASLAETAQRIGDVVALIRNIAEQTNLLALNATIEAARAGEMGRGFAVVASEVKALAVQTAKATEEIAGQIGSVQTLTANAVQSIGKISVRMREVNDYTSSAASAVTEQGGATGAISRNVMSAAESSRMAVSALREIASMAHETSGAAGKLLRVCDDVDTAARELEAEVGDFLGRVAR